MSKDLFSDQSEQYALYRPVYPQELFEYIVSFVTERKAAWDCATGNGQSALPLSHYFKNVVASDISEKQLAEAPRKENIEYLLSPAEKTPFADHSFDLITVAQAYHWFDSKRFCDEATRTGKNGAVVAVWMYDLLRSEESSLNNLIRFFYREIIGPYWDKERKRIDDHYSRLPFPFEPLPGKEFQIHTSFTRQQFEGYLFTWSAVQHFIRQQGFSPIKEIEKDLTGIWNGSEAKLFLFPVYLKMGRIKK